MRTRALSAWLAAASLMVTACSADAEDQSAEPSPSESTSSSSTVSDSPAPDTARPGLDPDDPALDAALSRPVEDRVYPDVGDPGVDALHYQLDLTWTPRSETLTGTETLIFRSTEDAEEFQLDFGSSLTAAAVRLDGKQAKFRQRGKDLVVQSPVRKDERYTLEVRYRGTPRPVAAPTTRDDFSTIGWEITDTGETWTMQEPFGAYSWYAVNDQPSDKALYDFTLTTRSPWVGVANGKLQSRRETGANTVTTWQLDEPAASYLVTVAFGNFKMTRDKSNGVPLTYWTPRGDAGALRSVEVAGDVIGWIEKKLGPFPFSSLGFIVVDSNSGMETQTMITLGNTDYTTARDTIVHEIVHQWYGDQVTPDDWRDLWMNEGMAMYLQFVWQSETTGTPIEQLLTRAATFERQSRKVNGPPAAYDPRTFGEIQVYYGPALMWDEIRRRVGDDTFWKMVRAWPSADADGSSNRDDYLPWIEEQTGAELSDLFDGWLFAKRSPKFD
jgi:aminopeptidase N